jgi:hypothetical protein
VAVLLAAATAGCELAMIGGASSARSFSTTDSMPIAGPRADVLDVVRSTGESLGYTVTAIDREHGSLTLTSQSAFAGQFVGYMHYATLMVWDADGGKTLKFNLSLAGTYGAGGEAEAEERLRQFKSKLGEALATR